MKPGRLVIGVTVCLRSQVFGVGELEGGGGKDRCDLGPLDSTNLCVSHTGRCWGAARKERPLLSFYTQKGWEGNFLSLGHWNSVSLLSETESSVLISDSRGL